MLYTTKIHKQIQLGLQTNPPKLLNLIEVKTSLFKSITECTLGFTLAYSGSCNALDFVVFAL